MNCPRCLAAFPPPFDSHLVHLEDTPDGLYAVLDVPVFAAFVVCGCGLSVRVETTQREAA